MARSGSTVRSSRFSKNEQGRYRLPVSAAVTTILAVGIVPLVGGVLAQAAPKPAPQETLKICKVAGFGVPVSPGNGVPPFRFTVGTKVVSVPAGPPPGGYCVVVGSNYPLGSIVTIKESPIPNGDQVSSITTNAVQVPPLNANIPPGRIIIRIGFGVNEVTYTNAQKVLPGNRTGYLEICKNFFALAGPFIPFSFTVGAQTVTVPAGACSPAIEVQGPGASFAVAVTEAHGPIMTGCSTLPAGSLLVSCDLALRTATVNVTAGPTASETILTINDCQSDVPDNCSQIPTLTTALSNLTFPGQVNPTDTATVTGNPLLGAPIGTVSLYWCASAVPTPCTSTAHKVFGSPFGLNNAGGETSTAVTQDGGFSASAKEYFCFLAEYSGDPNYAPVADNDPATECFPVAP